MNATHDTSRRVYTLALFCSAAVIVAMTSAYPQYPMQSNQTEPRMVVIPWRTSIEIDGDIENSQLAKRLALDRRARAEMRAKEIEINIETKRMASKDIGRRMDDAKKGNHASELISLQSEARANKQVVDLLNRLKDLRKAEIDEAMVETERADLDIAALQLETELLHKRVEYDSLSTAGLGELALTSTQQVLRDIEQRLLQLQQKRASATEKLASKQKDIVTRRIKLHEAQIKLGMPRA